MTGSLFGELEISSSYGLTRGIKPKFFKSNLILYVSGNCINSVSLREPNGMSNRNIKSSNGLSETQSLEPQKMLEYPPESHSKVLTAEGFITSFAIYPKESIIVYGERYSKFIRIVKWSQATNTTNHLTKLEVNGDMSINILSFSADGFYLAAVGDYPNHQITIWDWRTQKVISSISNEEPSHFLTFNPLDSKQFCTSGKSGDIKFWKIKVGFKKYHLIPTSGTVTSRSVVNESRKIDYNLDYPIDDDQKMKFYFHNWAPDKKVYASSEDGSELYRFSTETGEFITIVSAKTNPKLEELEENMKIVLLNARGFLVGGKDGKLRIINMQSELVRTTTIDPNCENIISLAYSPDYRTVLVEFENGKSYIHNTKTEASVLLSQIPKHQWVGMGNLVTDGLLCFARENGLVEFWKGNSLCKAWDSLIDITSITASSSSSLLVTGSKCGVVRIHTPLMLESNDPKLLFRHRLHDSEVIKLSVDGTGRYLASIGKDQTIWISSMSGTYKPLGYIKINGAFKNFHWESIEGSQKKSVKLFILTLEPDNSSTICSFEFQLSENYVLPVDESYAIQKHLISYHNLRLEQEAHDIFSVPSSFAAGKDTMYVLCNDKQLKIFTIGNSTNNGDRQVISIPEEEFKDHQLNFATFATNNSGEWILTLGSDGYATIRSVMEVGKSFKFHAHDEAYGGIKCAMFSIDFKHIYTMGYDGLIRTWDWKYSTTNGRRAALEAKENSDRLLADLLPIAEQLKETYLALEEIPEKVDSADEMLYVNGNDSAVAESKKELSNEKILYSNHITNKLKSISDRLSKLIAKNDLAPTLEKIDRSEFVIDLRERDRLLEETDKLLSDIRQQQETENIKKRIIRNRLKKECWDSMDTIGQSVKSFKIDSMIGRLLEVTNYPIRHRSIQEIRKIDNIKRLRRIQLDVQSAMHKKVEQEKHNHDHEEIPTETRNEPEKLPHSHLLYNNNELITKERRRIQSYIIGECINDIKDAFKTKFKDIVKSKQDDIQKIEEKNERISLILTQLQLQEKVYHPELDEDEMPETIIEVKDSEVTVERVLSAEELKKVELKRLQAEERLKNQGEDNFRQRALIQMMNGKLDDRKSQEEKEEVTKPEWMNKPKDEMSDEEKKLLKEFEKKMAIFKEEQEKHRKALETELRKLQAGISEIQDAFDQKLKEFSQYKLNVDKDIYERELKMIKQTHFAIISRNDDLMEIQLQKRIDQLKVDKANCTNEIPEIKKELERCREEYETALKKDKEIEKQFKKDFHMLELYFEPLSKLFKRRGNNNDSEEKDGDEILNPFANFEKDVPHVDMSPAPLTVNDMPDGLNPDIWTKLIDIRDKKIAIEQEVLYSSRSFKEMQSMVQNVLEESDKIKAETEKALIDLNQFTEFKFKNTYNIETLFELKQGQVEVPQAPIVTNYTDAVLLDRSVVEQLNEQVRTLGQLKVDALTEIKEYRKGIHALEWENKMFDFQADDLVIRTRDIQLLRVSKEMQEYLRSGDAHKQSSEISNLEKISDHSQKTHIHVLQDKKEILKKLDRKTRRKEMENRQLETQISDLNMSVHDRLQIHDIKVSKGSDQPKRDIHRELFTRRRLVDLAKSQAQDIAILREELERLRLRTYPAFRV
ncbi:WD40-repeat-containing domain protein [Globomyces pollinis-pini]|nr:WD40-repeat-containing domain protein [Globomyces pollinis-pini]